MTGTPNTERVQIEVSVVVVVDLDEYADTYNLDAEHAEKDAAEYLERIVSEAVQQQVGPHKALDWGRLFMVTSRGLGGHLHD